jgi:hypothetical protein
VLMHEIPSARLIYPTDGPTSGYFYRHPDPSVPAYWLDDIVPSIETDHRELPGPRAGFWARVRSRCEHVTLFVGATRRRRHGPIPRGHATHVPSS